MSESPVDSALYNEEALSDELPDAALEVAASKYWERAGNLYTLAFCTGLDSCPTRATQVAGLLRAAEFARETHLSVGGSRLPTVHRRHQQMRNVK
jgi:hypothetical protein